MRQTLLSAGIVSTSQLATRSQIAGALPVTPSLLDLAIPCMVLYMLYLYNCCVCLQVEILHHYSTVNPHTYFIYMRVLLLVHSCAGILEYKLPLSRLSATYRMASPQKCITLGIDLGTTYSCAAVFIKDVPKTVNMTGCRTTASWVWFKDNNTYIVGEVAKRFAGKSAVYDSKRMLGREYTDPLLQEDMKRWVKQFSVINVEGLPKIVVDTRKEQTFSPEEISSYILRNLKEQAEKKYGGKVTRAVVTVPAYFNNSQRKATMDAAKLAGLEVLRLFSEPLAAALAYGLDKITESDVKNTILVFDLGGGTLDLSVVNINGGTFDVLAINGNTHLGGEDFTNRLFDYVMDEFKKKGVLLLNAEGDMRERCDAAKKILSIETTTDIHYYSDSITVSRAKFEDLNRDLFDSILTPLQQVLDDAGLKKWAIDEVVMTGGSVRIPKIVEIVEAFFKPKTLNMSVDVDEAVAHGAAILAAHLAGDESSAPKHFNIHDVTPLSLGIELRDKSMCTVVKRNTRIPLTSSYTFTTADDNQASGLFSVYEGERPLVKDNTFLGQFVLKNIPPFPRGVPNLDSVFEIDRDGILTIKATLRGTTNSSQIVIRKEGRMEASQVRECILQAQELHSLDEKTRMKQAARNQLERYIYDVRKKVEVSLLPSHEKQYLLDKCESFMSWMNGQDLFQNECHDEKRKENLYETREYEDKLNELARDCARRRMYL